MLHSHVFSLFRAGSQEQRVVSRDPRVGESGVGRRESAGGSRES